ncbi:MAG: hypothetical protein GXO58_05260 [Thermodesulfobacteria bacterium]|nr:hypothetical protein [Thermodesulfobacteriota bacterium]
MKTRREIIIDTLTREWLLLASIAGLGATSAYLHHLPEVTSGDLYILFLLFALFITVRGLETSGLLQSISIKLEGDSLAPLKLTVATFVASMIFTNDAALVVIVPITLAVNLARKDLLIILESLAANAGSALTPFGNPQNLYIYWHYGLKPLEFSLAIAPFSFVFFCLLVACSIFCIPSGQPETTPTHVNVNLKKGIAFMAANLIVILSILKILPLSFTIFAIVLAICADPEVLKIDYGILVTMLCFMAISQNVKTVIESAIEHSDHIFLLSSLSSQVISNVPAALLFAKFTTNWKALLWGTNVGGFGGLVGSLANLIAYKKYISSQERVDTTDFTRKFVVANYAFFLVGIALFYLVKGYLYG